MTRRILIHCTVAWVALLASGFPVQPARALGPATPPVLLVAGDSWDQQFWEQLLQMINWLQCGPPPQLGGASRDDGLNELIRRYTRCGIPSNLAETGQAAMGADVRAFHDHLRLHPERLTPAIYEEAVRTLRAMYSDLGFDPGGL